MATRGGDGGWALVPSDPGTEPVSLGQAGLADSAGLDSAGLDLAVAGDLLHVAGYQPNRISLWSLVDDGVVPTGKDLQLPQLTRRSPEKPVGLPLPAMPWSLAGGTESALAARTGGGQIWLGRYDFDGRWLEPPLPMTQLVRDLRDDDVARPFWLGDQVGVAWSDQARGAIHFARRSGRSDWVVESPLAGPLMADDHLDISVRGGVIAAVVKTSRNDGSDPVMEDPLVVLLVRRPDGTWHRQTLATVHSGRTRARIVLAHDGLQAVVMSTEAGRLVIEAIDLGACLDGRTVPAEPRPTPTWVPVDHHLANPSTTSQAYLPATGLWACISDEETHGSLAGPIL